MVDLQRRVLDPELGLEQALELAATAVAVLAGSHEDVRGERRKARRDRPHVEVVHLDDARRRGEPPAERGSVDPPRRRLEEDRGRVAQDRPRAREDEESDEDAHERVGLDPARREDHDRRDGDAERAEEIGEDVTERSLDVEAVAARTGQDETGRDVHRHADERDREHPAAEHVAGVAQPHRRLDEDPDRERDQEHAVGERGENLRALVAVRPLGRRRLGREPRGDERECERDVVREHVHRVREQGEAPRVEAADDLDGRIRRRQDECDGERAATLDARVVVIVAHAWVLPGGAGGSAACPAQGSVQKPPGRTRHHPERARSDPRDRRGRWRPPRPSPSSPSRARRRTGCRRTRTATRSGRGSTRSRSRAPVRCRARTPA